MTFYFKDLHTAFLFWRLFDGTELDVAEFSVKTDGSDLSEKVLAHHVFTEVAP
jgi:hypothetical protein